MNVVMVQWDRHMISQEQRISCTKKAKFSITIDMPSYDGHHTIRGFKDFKDFFDTEGYVLERILEKIAKGESERNDCTDYMENQSLKICAICVIRVLLNHIFFFFFTLNSSAISLHSSALAFSPRCKYTSLKYSKAAIWSGLILTTLSKSVKASS